MTGIPKHGRRDTSEKPIVEGLRQIGATVAYINYGGFDIIVGFRRQNFLLEVKTRKGKLTDKEREFRDTWQGQWAQCNSLELALQAIGAIE